MMLIVLWLYVANDCHIQLVDPSIESFDGWYLVDESGQQVPFDQKGHLTLRRDPASRTFEIVDPRGRLRFIGTWQQESNLTIDVQGTALGIHEVVSGKRSQQDAFDAAAEIEVIAPAEQVTRNAVQSSDWLKEQAEVALQKTNLGGGSPIIRGMSGNRILLMIDGFRINNAIFRLGLNQYLNTIPDGQLSQIEVLSGPSGTQYGSDGLGGTVHLRTADPLDQKGTHLSYLGFASSADQTSTHQLEAGTRGSDWAIAGHFKASNLNDLDAASPVGSQAFTGYETWDASLRLALDLGNNRRIRINNTYSRSDEVPRTDRLQSGRDLVWNYDPQILQTHSIRFEGQKLTRWFDYFDIGLAVFRQEEGTTRISSRVPDLQERESTLVETNQVAVTLTKVTGSISWNYGFDAHRDLVDSSGMETDLGSGDQTVTSGKFPDDAQYGSFGLFAIGDWGYSETQSLQVGARHTMASMEGTLPTLGPNEQEANQFTPSVIWRMKQQPFVFSAGIAQGFRTPNLEDAFSVGFSSLGFDAPNPELEPEYVWNYEVGMRWRSARHLAQLAAYSSHYDGLIERVPGTYEGSDTYEGEPVFILDNVGKARVYGFSASWQSQLSPAINLLSDVAWTHGTQTDRDEPMTRIQPLRGNLILKGEWREHHGSLVFSWADRQDRLSPNDRSDSRIPDGGTPGYGVVHLRYGRAVTPRIHVKAAIENLFDKLYKTHGSGIYEPGRRLTVSLKIVL
ncbi:MAG: TonB-dependent receptor [Acidobacteria bacterium]|nr:TonB-dependent receptor [Acidobacteriota bacterium]